MPTIKTKRSTIFLILFVISIVVFVGSLWKRIIHIDDVWLAEYSYWLAKIGYVKSEAMRGFYDAEIKLYVYHKLLAIEGAWFIKLFGFDPYVLKSLSLIYVLGAALLLSSLYQKYSQSKNSSLLLLAMFLSFFHTMNLGFTFRPEMHLAFWGLLSLIFLEKYLDEHKRIFLVLSAFVTGIGTATHLNGVVYTGAAVLLLWFNRKWLAGLIYGVVATWGLLFYFLIDAHSLAELRQSYLQLANWRDVATGKYGWELILRVFEEQGRYLHSPPEIIYSLMLLLLLIPARKYLIGSVKRIVYYTIFLSVCVAEVTHGTNTNYLMYAFPFLLLLSVWSFERLVSEGRPKIAWSAVMIFLVGSWAYDINKFSVRETMAPEYAKVAQFLPENAKVLAPAHLMFDGLEKLQIQSFITYRDKTETGKLKRTGDDLFAEATKYDIEYVVVDSSNAAFFQIANKNYADYIILVGQPSKKFQIYKKQ